MTASPRDENPFIIHLGANELRNASRKHRRILRESLKSGIAAARKEIAEGKWDGWSGAHSAAFRFAPYALAAIAREE